MTAFSSATEPTNTSDQTQITLRLNPIAGAVAIAVGSITLASGATAATTYFDDEMIVSSTRRDANVQDVPFNIAAFSGDNLEKQRLNNLNQFARWIPGLNLTDQGQRAANPLTVRGLNATSLQASEAAGNNSGGTVATYVGEIPVYVDLKMYDIDRVEVLLGPQGTLFGASTLAGAVRYIPAVPDLNDTTLDTHVKAYDQGESDDYGYGGDLTLNLPIIPDTLAFRGTVGWVNEPGYIDYNYLVREAGVSNPEPDFTNPADVAANLTRKEDVNDEQTLNFRGSLRWDISDTLSTTFRYDYQNKEVGGRNAVHSISFDTGPYESGHRFVEPNERTNNIASLVIEWDMGFADLTSATGYSEYHDDGQRDQTDLLMNFEYGYEDFPAFAAFTRDIDDVDTITQELRLVSNNDGPVNWLAGAFYSKLKQDASSREFTPGIPEFFGIAPPPLPTGDLEYLQLTKDEQEEIAVYGEVGLQITDRWQVTGGARWFDYETDTDIKVDLPLIDYFGPWQNRKSDGDDTIFKINTSVDLDGLIAGMSAGTVYATVSEGFRIGGANVFDSCQMPLPPGQNICLLPQEEAYDPDTTINYEVGLKSTWFDDALLFNISAFYVHWDEIQLDSISINGDVPITINASEAKSIGTEIASRWTITDRLSVYGSYAYTKAELTKDAPNTIGVRNALPEDAFDGDQLPGTPVNQGSLNFSYNQPLGSGDLSLDIDYGFTSMDEVYTKTGLRGRGEALPGFTIHHFSAALSGEQWTATLFVDNLFDKYAQTGVRNDTDFIDKRADGDGLGANNFTLRRYYHNILRPRTIGIDLRYRFDL